MKTAKLLEKLEEKVDELEYKQKEIIKILRGIMKIIDDE